MDTVFQLSQIDSNTTLVFLIACFQFFLSEIFISLKIRREVKRLPKFDGLRVTMWTVNMFVTQKILG